RPGQGATWPWKGVAAKSIHPGVARWYQPATPDGTALELYRFDLKANPKIHLEMYDQDEDDAVPFDNKTDYFNHNAAWVAKHLEDRGKVIAVWNGMFHGYDRTPGGPPEGQATHIGPNVIRGKARYNFGSIRWAFGVKDRKFLVLNEPKIAEMQEKMTYGAIGAQCLILDGKPLELQSIRKSTFPHEAGWIEGVDELRTSRTSMAWSRDHRYFYLLCVFELDNEITSKRAYRDRISEGDGGWTVADLQKFWISFGADFAVNSDGGMVAQLFHLQADGSYEFVPPKWVSDKRVKLGPTLEGAPKGGGTLMSWVIVEED
ncbi:MAG: phosphodiester glycosidase family protein, partial [Fimbriimonadaceae bacterium]